MNAQPEIKSDEVRCPHCKSKDIVPSQPRGWMDALLRKWGAGRVPRHCRYCGKRFYMRATLLKGEELASFRATQNDIEHDLVAGEVRCPSCNSADLVVAVANILIDPLARKWGGGYLPRECRRCGRRFYVAVKRLKNPY